MRWRASRAGCKVSVHQQLDGTITLAHSPHRLGRYSAQGMYLGDNKLGRGRAVEKMRGGKVIKPTLPPRLGIPQTPRDSRLLIALTTAARLTQTGRFNLLTTSESNWLSPYGNSNLIHESPEAARIAATRISITTALESPPELHSSTNSVHLTPLRSLRNSMCCPTAHSCLYTNCQSYHLLREDMAPL